MKILIPMAGAGSRFRNIGLNKAKHAILANGHSLFYWSMLSLKDFFGSEFIFICRTEDLDRDFILGECSELGITRTSFVSVDHLTEGQASTVMLCDDLLKDEDSVAIYNIDTYTEPGFLLRSDILNTYHGYTPSFIAEGYKWSFVRVLPDDESKVVEVSEKVRISNLGTLGFYYFSSWKDFRSVYLSKKEEIKAKYKETYIAPMYKYFIEQDKDVRTKIIPVDKIHVLGTPEDLSEFCPAYLDENR